MQLIRNFFQDDFEQVSFFLDEDDRITSRGKLMMVTENYEQSSHLPN